MFIVSRRPKIGDIVDARPLKEEAPGIILEVTNVTKSHFLPWEPRRPAVDVEIWWSIPGKCSSYRLFLTKRMKKYQISKSNVVTISHTFFERLPAPKKEKVFGL